MVVLGEHAPYNILVDLYAKSLRDDHGDSRTAKVWISPFKFDDGVNELIRRVFWSRLRSGSRGEQQTVLPAD